MVKDGGTAGGWKVATGRRPSTLLLIEKLRKAVDAWRTSGYEGVSEITRRLLEFWFEEDHLVPAFGGVFRYHFGQREAIETLIYVVEVLGHKDVQKTIKQFGTVYGRELFGAQGISFQSLPDGTRQVRRYVAEVERELAQDLPPSELRRYAFKMATGSGKTWVMAMAVVWSHFHRKMVKGSNLSTNFLIISPNVIVHQRLERDFLGSRIFYQLPLVPPEWGSLDLNVISRGDTTERTSPVTCPSQTSTRSTGIRKRNGHQKTGSRPSSASR